MIEQGPPETARAQDAEKGCAVEMLNRVFLMMKTVGEKEGVPGRMKKVGDVDVLREIGECFDFSVLTL